MEKIFELRIEEDDELSGIDSISLVDEPAIEVNWIAFSKIKQEEFHIPDGEDEIYLQKLAAIAQDENELFNDGWVIDTVEVLTGKEQFNTNPNRDSEWDENNTRIRYKYMLNPNIKESSIIPTTRDFCRDLVQKNFVWRVEEMDSLVNDFGSPAIVWRGGFNCRHVWGKIRYKREGDITNKASVNKNKETIGGVFPTDLNPDTTILGYPQPSTVTRRTAANPSPSTIKNLGLSKEDFEVGIPHYTEDGKLYEGPTHKDSDGRLMTGEVHTEDSEYLYHEDELGYDVSTITGYVDEVPKKKKKDSYAEVGPRGGIRESDKAPKSDTKNPNPKGEGTAKGDASGKRGTVVTQAQEKTLQGKVDDFNEKDSNTKNGRAALGALKSVFQRGLGAYNTSRSPVVKSAEQWAYARVNAFLYLLKNGRPENPKYTTDYDLLPNGHPKAEKNMSNKENFKSYSDYPDSVKNNARAVLKYVEENGWGSCGTTIGRGRATDLANGSPISEDTIKRMYSYLSRHEVDLESSKAYGDGCGKLMYDAWGGKSAMSWAESKINSIEKEKMSKQNFAIGSIEKRIVVGPAMVPDLKIFRKDEKGNPYQVFFSAETIKMIAEKYMRYKYIDNNDTNHNGEAAKDVYVIESWIKEDMEDKSNKYGYGELPVGTWFVAMKVRNDEVWDKVKNGVLNGFSVSGFFEEVAQFCMEEMFLKELSTLLHKIKD